MYQLKVHEVWKGQSFSAGFFLNINVNMANNIIAYLNTLIFCVVACAIIVTFLILMFAPGTSEFIFLLITIDIGLVIIVFYSLSRIINYEEKREETTELIRNNPSKRDKQLEDLKVMACPDYYSRSVRDGVVYCKNGLDMFDPITLARQQTIQYVKADATTTSPNPPVPPSEINLTTLVEEKTVQSVCNKMVQTYNMIPWVSVKAWC